MHYYFSIDGTSQQGPLDADRLAAAGVGPETMVWCEGMAAWTPAGRVPDLAGRLAPPPPPAPPPGGFPVRPPPDRRPAPLPHASPGQSMPLPPGGLLHPQYATPHYERTAGTNGLAIASLVLGIVGVFTFCCWVPSILAIVFGYNARGQIRRGHGGGMNLALAGLILGWLGILFAVLGITFRFSHGHFYYNGRHIGF